MGMGILPLYAAIDGLRNGSLVRILPEFKFQKMNIHALYRSHKFIDAKTRKCLDLLRDVVPRLVARDEALLGGVETSKSATAYAAL
jgi:DNA-binding transcriptional LysR family regulator